MSAAEFCPIGRVEKLLLAADRSEYSEGAVREAIRIAEKCSSRLYVITVVEMNPEYETFGTNVTQGLEREAAEYFAYLKKMAAEKGVSCETILRESGEPYRLIVDEAAGKGIDMIIMGRRGRKGLEKVLMGSTVAKVIGHAPCNVLVVPRAARVEFKNILIATDGSEYAGDAASTAIEIAKDNGSHVIVLSAYFLDNELATAESNVKRVLEIAQQKGVEAEVATPRGKPYDAIIETAGGRAVDLIVMGAYGKTGLKKLLMGSSTEKVIGLAGCAVMVARRVTAG